MVVILEPEEGAKKILLEAVRLRKGDNLIILAHENRMLIVDYLIKASKLIGNENVLLVHVPEALRPITKVSDMLAGAVAKADALIYVADRMPEETATFTFGSLLNICKENKCKYIYMYDTKLSYLKEGGVFADYGVVEEKCKRVQEILQKSVRVDVTSTLGTSITFSLSNKFNFTSPIIGKRGRVQAPDGEVRGHPIKETFTGKIVVDGATTGIGIPESPITLIFEKGRRTAVQGEKKIVSRLLKYMKRCNKGIKSLVDLPITEFSVATNDWTILDDNISSSEKLAGTVHFCIGGVCYLLTRPNVIVTEETGKKITLIERGKLLL